MPSRARWPRSWAHRASASNAICPGLIDTYRMDDVPRGEVWDDMVARIVPLRRAGSGDDIAWFVVYLCSDQGSWITGQFHTVDGGTAAGR